MIEDKVRDIFADMVVLLCIALRASPARQLLMRESKSPRQSEHIQMKLYLHLVALSPIIWLSRAQHFVLMEVASTLLLPLLSTMPYFILLSF